MPKVNRRIVAMLSIAFGFITLPSTGSAAAIFFQYGGEVIEKIADFPHTPDFSDGQNHIDAGIRYKEFSIFLIPIFQYDKTYCGSIEGDDSHYKIMTKKELDELGRTANVIIPDPVYLGFWREWGGKLLMLSIIIAAALYEVRKRKSESKSQNRHTGNIA